MGLFGTTIRTAGTAVGVGFIGAFLSTVLSYLQPLMQGSQMAPWFQTVSGNATAVGVLSALIALVAVGVRVRRVPG